MDSVQSLLDKSLLVEREGSDREPRYWMLETIHEYAREKLAEVDEGNGVEEEALGREHALYFMKLAEEAEPGLMGDKQAQWLGRLEDDHDNLRAALRWARQAEETQSGMRNEERGIRNRGRQTIRIPFYSAFAGAVSRVEVGLRIAVAISQFWLTRGYFSEGREQLEGLLTGLPFTSSSLASWP